jgi:hypothetical protein
MCLGTSNGVMGSRTSSQELAVNGRELPENRGGSRLPVCKGRMGDGGSWMVIGCFFGLSPMADAKVLNFLGVFGGGGAFDCLSLEDRQECKEGDGECDMPMHDKTHAESLRLDDERDHQGRCGGCCWTDCM